MTSSETLNQLLDQGLEFDPHYLPSMNSDHLPMTLCAMTRLGASDSSLLAYRDDYSKILRPIEVVSATTDWKTTVGRVEEYPALRAYMLEEVKHRGIHATIAEYLPEYIGSLAFDAFHPLIRLAYAIDAKHPGEVANALAYWIVSHRDVRTDTDRVVSLKDELQRQVESGPIRFPDARFAAGLRQLIANNAYPAGVAGSFQECAASSLDVYRSTRNFFALHMVTATQAARTIAGLIDETEVLSALTGSLLAAHLVVGSPAFERALPLPVPEYLDREHTYKYAYACSVEYREYGDNRYLEEFEGFRQSGLLAPWVQIPPET